MMKVVPEETPGREIDPAVAAYQKFRELEAERWKLLNQKEVMLHTHDGKTANRFDDETVKPLEQRFFAAEREFLNTPSTTLSGAILKIEHLMHLTSDWCLELSHLQGVHQDLTRFLLKERGGEF